MYSLYRAWFGDGAPGENYPRLQETLSPPDTVVRVGNEGEHQFVAHKGVLAAHSGYLKALLASATTSSSPSVSSSFGSCSTLPATAIAVTATNVVGQTPRQPVTSVSVSSIGGEAFAPLLNYMYTGRLEVTLDNVYSVLLATHLLHMPGALEQCRAALLRLRAPAHLPTPMPVPGPAPAPTSTATSTSGTMPASSPGTVNILRPIPNRLMVGPGMCWPPPAPLYPAAAPAPGIVGIPHLPQLQSSVLMQSTVPPAVSVLPAPAVHEPQSTAHYSAEVPSPKSSPTPMQRSRGARVELRSRSPEIVPSATLPFVAAAAAAFTAFTASNITASSATRASTPSQSASPAPSSASPSPSPLRRGKKPSPVEQQRAAREDREYEDSSPGSGRTPRHKSPVISIEESPTGNRDSATETLSVTESDRGARSSRRRNRSSNNGSEGSASNILSVVYDVACCDGPVRFHRVLNENYSSAAVCGAAQVPQPRVQRACMEIESTSSENDENGGPAAARGGCETAEPSADAANGNGSYTCGYCRHTFKSQYCYRKHAKRHLLPTRVNESAGSRRQEAARGRREVRLLDLNVQYYPCKICGCKFPSYYFVHKHRKLCHANAEERGRTEPANGGSDQDQESAASANQKSP